MIKYIVTIIATNDVKIKCFFVNTISAQVLKFRLLFQENFVIITLYFNSVDKEVVVIKASLLKEKETNAESFLRGASNEFVFGAAYVNQSEYFEK